MTRSLRKSLILWLLLPTALALITFLPLAYHLVHQPAMEALDQALADASLALVPHLEVVDGEPRFVFPPAAEQVLRTDRVDDIYYLVLGPAGRFIAGDIGLPHEPPEDVEAHGERVSFDAHFRNHRVRVIAIHREIAGSPFVFVTAETTRKRDQLAVDLAVALILPLLDESDEPMDDENLIDYGLDSVRMMALAARWRKVHGDIDFVMLAKNPTIDAWWALLSREVH